MAEFRSAPTRANRDERDLSPVRGSYEGRGCLPITQAIKHGDFLKVSAEREGIRVEVHFNFNANASSRNKGTCEIHGGPLAGTGVIVDVKREQVSDFKDFFTCQTSSGDGRHFLRWQIGVNEFVDADRIIDNETSEPHGRAGPFACGGRRPELPASRDRRRVACLVPHHPRPSLQRKIVKCKKV